MTDNRNERIQTLRNKVWLSTTECMWVLGCTYNNFNRLAVEKHIRNWQPAGQRNKFSSEDIFHIYDKAMGISDERDNTSD